MDHALSHLINQIGASSVSSNKDEYTPWMSIDHPDAFIPSQPKSEDSNNANPPMPNYMFGLGRKLRTYLYFGNNECHQSHSVHYFYHTTSCYATR